MKRLAAATAVAVLAGVIAMAQQQPTNGSGGAIGPTPIAGPTANQPPQYRDPYNKSKADKKGPTKDDILRDAAALAKANNLACEVSDAALLNEGTAAVNGKAVHVRAYETACANGVGYFLIDQAPEPTQSFSCFAAEATHAADVAAGREPQAACSLPANADTKKAAAAVLARLGQQCVVTNLHVIGLDTKAHAELTEVACSGGTGFVIATPLLGATQAISALSCPDSYRRGVSCRLSSNGAPLVTADTFKQALAQHKIACTAENVRLVGRQNVSKRHVVEFKCPEQPNGLIAFIPLEDSTAPFEVMDCPTAGNKQKIICTLTQIH